MQYSFTCPLAGCTWSATVDASSREEALDKLSHEAGEHVKMVHPEVTKTPDEVRTDVSTLMKEGPAEDNSIPPGE